MTARTPLTHSQTWNGASPADTPELWANVVDSWRQVVRPFPLATALVRAGAAHAAVERYDDARPLLAKQSRSQNSSAPGHWSRRRQPWPAAPPADARNPSTPPQRLGLTPRELDVLRLVAEGASNPAIAEALVISPKTASVHVSNILAKLGVGNRGEAAAVAHRRGIV